MRNLVYAVAVAAISLAACKSSSATNTPAPTSSTNGSSVQGTLDVGSFASPPSAVVATDENGQKLNAPVAADGSFALSVPVSHVYALTVLTQAGQEPVVFPRTTGKLDRTFKLGSAPSSIAFGKVHHLSAAPQDDHADGETHDDAEGQDGQDAPDGPNACETNDDGEQADATQPMAVPATNPPASGCVDEGDGDGETQD